MEGPCEAITKRTKILGTVPLFKYCMLWGKSVFGVFLGGGHVFENYPISSDGCFPQAERGNVCIYPGMNFQVNKDSIRKYHMR